MRQLKKLKSIMSNKNVWLMAGGDIVLLEGKWGQVYY